MMKVLKSITVLAISATLFTACNSNEPAADEQLNDAANVVEEASGQAIETAKEGVEAGKIELVTFRDLTAAELEEAKRNFDQLSDDAKKIYLEQVAKAEQAAKDAKSATVNKVEEVKDEMKTLENATNKSVETFRKEMNKKP